MSQNSSLRTARFSFVPLGSDLPCANLKNWLKNGETSSDKASRASNPALVHPTGRYVLKVWTQGKEKIMINVCTDPSRLLDPCSVPGGFVLPHSASAPRKDVDLKKQPCLVVDVTFGEEAFTLAEQSALFIQYLHQAALNAAQTALKVNLQRDRVATPKLKCKGAPESFEMSTALSERVQVTEEDSLIQVKLTGLTQTLPGDRVRYNLAQDYLEIDLKRYSHDVSTGLLGLHEILIETGELLNIFYPFCVVIF
jgi:PIH1 N-terminal domain